MANKRITTNDLDWLAASLTESMLDLRLIEPWQSVQRYSAYGGHRFDVTGEFQMLDRLFGTNMDNWPAGWSGHRSGFAGLPDGFLTPLALWQRGVSVSGALRAVLQVHDFSEEPS